MNKRCVSLGISLLMMIVLVFSFIGCGKKVEEPKYESDERFRFFAYLAPIPGNSEFGNKEDYINETQYGYIRDGGFTDAIAMYERNDDDAMRALAAAEATGVNYYVRNNTLYGSSARPIEDLSILDTMFDRYKDEPAFVGNYGDDEAPATKFPYLKTVKDKYEEILPDKDLLINLLPTYATTAQLGADSYEEYIQTYIDVMDPDYVMYDHYPLLKGANDKESSIREDFLRNLEVVAYLTSNAGIDFYNFIQVGAHMSYRDTDLSDLRFQIYSSMAYGSKGISYFTYWSPYDTYAYFGETIISKEGERTRRYYEAQQVNNEVHAFEETYLNFEWQGTMTFLGNEMYDNPRFLILEHTLESHPRIKSVETDQDLIIGTFKDKDGNDAFMIVNNSDPFYKQTANVTIEFNDANNLLMYRFGEKIFTGMKNSAFTFELQPGEGRFVVPV